MQNLLRWSSKVVPLNSNIVLKYYPGLKAIQNGGSIVVNNLERQNDLLCRHSRAHDIPLVNIK